MNKDEIIRCALDALEAIAWSNNTTWQSQRAKIEVDAIKEALAQPYPDNFIDALKFDMALREFSCPRCGHVCSQSIESGS